jgi:hypothetical protein
MKKKVLNTDDNDTLNPMADTRNYGAGTKDGMAGDPKKAGSSDDDIYDDIDTNDEYSAVEPLAGEVDNAAEPDDEDEMA